MHLDAFICFVKDDGAIAACYDSFIVLISLDLSHLRVDSADVAYLGSPERASMLHVEVFMTLTHLVTVRVVVFNVKARFHIDLEVKER